MVSVSMRDDDVRPPVLVLVVVEKLGCGWDAHSRRHQQRGYLIISLLTR